MLAMKPNEKRDALMGGAGSRLRVFRDERGLTQPQLAELLEITFPYVSKLEAGRKTPSLALAVRIKKLTKDWFPHGPIDEEEWV